MVKLLRNFVGGHVIRGLGDGTAWTAAEHFWCGCGIVLEFSSSLGEVGMFGIEKGAVLSEDQRYRYSLWRKWSNQRPLGFVMLNPSTADASVDDPTIWRCMEFARREQCGGIEVINLSPLRATDPKVLYTTILADRSIAFPCDETQDLAHTRFYSECERVVFAWGAFSGAVMTVRKILEDVVDKHRVLAAQFGKNPFCLGRSLGGAPKHPLYLRSDAVLIPW